MAPLEKKRLSQIVLRSSQGFTLVEILVGLILIGIIGTLIASAAKQGILSSQRLLDQGANTSKAIVLRRILHRDIHHMLWQSSLESTSRGFQIKTGHNLLLNSSFPAVVTWTFNPPKVLRREEISALDYVLEQELISDITSHDLALMSARDRQWVSQKSWLMSPQQPRAVALRLRLQVEGWNAWEIIERLPH
jgi:prepilin-type N-terminal cleavage/methylation domain-containing protein